MINHWPLSFNGREKKTLCGTLAPASEADGSHSITCPDCRARLASKAEAAAGMTTSEAILFAVGYGAERVHPRYLAEVLALCCQDKIKLVSADQNIIIVAGKAGR